MTASRAKVDAMARVRRPFSTLAATMLIVLLGGCTFQAAGGEARCGDGVVDPGEGCDDGNEVDGDGCSAACAVVDQACGDGVTDPDEACDDGNADNGDGCDINCTLTGCGNTIVTAGEACDDGNLIDDDACGNDCRIPGCGDMVIGGTEACDDGNEVDGDGCDINCTFSACGNGVIAPDEACDDLNVVDGDGCDSDCSLTGCGNGIVTFGEACDELDVVEGDGCDSNCTVSACGNDVAAPLEGCDDGDLDDGDGCDSNCTPTGCGNGIVTAAEACDDGNTFDDDGTCDGGPDDGGACGASVDCAPVRTPIALVSTTTFATELDDFEGQVPLAGASGHRLLVVAVTTEGDFGQGPSSVTFDGVELKLAVTVQATTLGFTNTSAIYYQTEDELPASGASYTLAITAVGVADTHGAVYAAMELDNVDASGPEVTATTTRLLSEDSVSQAITTSTDGAWIFDAIATGFPLGAGFTPTLQTERVDLNASSMAGAAGTYVKTVAGTVSLGWTCETDCNRIAYSLAAFRPHPEPVACLGCDAQCALYE